MALDEVKMFICDVVKALRMSNDTFEKQKMKEGRYLQNLYVSGEGSLFKYQ